ADPGARGRRDPPGLTTTPPASTSGRSPPTSPSPHGDGLPGAGGDPVFVQAVHRVRVLEHWQSDVPYPDPAGCKALLRALMRVTVHGEVRPGRVDRLPQQVAAEERIDLRRLPRQSVLSGGVMRQADDDVGVQVRQRL